MSKTKDKILGGMPLKRWNKYTFKIIWTVYLTKRSASTVTYQKEKEKDYENR